jgi:hypothetical protein
LFVMRVWISGREDFLFAIFCLLGVTGCSETTLPEERRRIEPARHWRT